MPAKMTRDEWIAKAEKVHGKGTYDYSEVDYKNGDSMVKIKCNKCGNYFYQRAHCHLQGKGCRDCSIKEGHNILKQRAAEKWYKESQEKFGDICDYSESIYVNTRTPIKIKCKECGTVFYQKPRVHLKSKVPCPECLKKKVSKEKRSNTEEFIKKAENVHGKEEYDYSKVEYKDAETPLLIIDLKRDGEEFWQKPSNHLQVKGNPSRRQSEGEVQISRWLRENNIEFSSEVTIRNIPGRRGEESLVRIDFCLTYNDKNYWIEFNGEQHYKFKRDILIGRRKTPEEQLEHFSQQVNRDKHVREYCKENNIIFVEIPYTYDTFNKISEVLNKIIIENLDPGDVLVIPEVDYTLTEQQKAKYKYSDSNNLKQE